MCLQAIVERGISKKIHARVCEDICFTYGLQHVVSLTNLANLGLFYEQGYIKEPYNFNDIKKELKLLPDAPQNSGENPSDPSFAYGGYTPIVYYIFHAGQNLLKQLFEMVGKASQKHYVCCPVIQ